MRISMVAVLAGLSSGPVWAQAPVERLPGTITTHAMARGRLANTVADVSIGVEAHAGTVAATQSAMSIASGRLMGYLRQQGVERLRTDQLSIAPRTYADKGKPERIVGYDGSVQASFRVPAERLDAVIAGALANGGNDLARTAILPRETEVDAERARLAAEAAKIALSQAAAVAGATGRHLGAIRQIEVDPAQDIAPPLPTMMQAAKAMPVAAAPVATAAGDVEVTASVSVTVNLVEAGAPP